MQRIHVCNSSSHAQGQSESLTHLTAFTGLRVLALTRMDYMDLQVLSGMTSLQALSLAGAQDLGYGALTTQQQPREQMRDQAITELSRLRRLQSLRSVSVAVDMSTCFDACADPGHHKDWLKSPTSWNSHAMIVIYLS